MCLSDRDSSVQRQYAKLFHVAPAPNLSDQTRLRIREDAIALAKRVGLCSAASVVYLIDTGSLANSRFISLFSSMYQLVSTISPTSCLNWNPSIRSWFSVVFLVRCVLISHALTGDGRGHVSGYRTSADPNCVWIFSGRTWADTAVGHRNWMCYPMHNYQ